MSRYQHRCKARRKSQAKRYLQRDGRPFFRPQERYMNFHGVIIPYVR